MYWYALTIRTINFYDSIQCHVLKDDIEGEDSLGACSEFLAFMERMTNDFEIRWCVSLDNGSGGMMVWPWFWLYDAHTI